MGYFITHNKAVTQRYPDNVTMTDRIMTSWHKFDDDYNFADDRLIYILLDPSLQLGHMTEA
ncbi:hypothetical protein MY11210_009210 [Beauveria gryllotalpidicola]